jgi:hypothetical protein
MAVNIVLAIVKIVTGVIGNSYEERSGEFGGGGGYRGGETGGRR